MKVILLAPTPPPMGGIAKWTTRMMEAELENGWEVEVVDEKIIGNREFFGDKIKHDWCAEIKRCFRIWKNLFRALKDKDAKVVHACIPANTMPVLRECISALITKIRRRKFIIHFRCTVPNMVKSGMNRFAVKCLCILSDCVMLLNKSSVDYIESLCKTKVELIPNFVESTEIGTKKEIRDCAKNLEIEIFDKPSTPCLATRFPYGTKLSTQLLQTVEQGEIILKEFGFLNNRIRIHNEIARIEIPQEDFKKFIEQHETIIKSLKSLGLKYISLDIEGLRSGSMDL